MSDRGGASTCGLVPASDDLFPPILHGLATSSAPPRRPITVPVIGAMVRHGILGSKAPVYLWRGRLARRPMPTREHSNANKFLYDAFHALAPDRPHAESHQALSLTREDAVLIPDASIIRGRADDYPDVFPEPADLRLVAEVVDLPHEHLLADVYAAEGIPTYWEVHLARRRVTVFHEPAGSSYRASRSFGPGSAVPVVLDGREVGRVGVDEILR